MALIRICPVTISALGVFSLAAASCGPMQQSGNSAQNARSDWFVDATAQTGLQFTHINGMSGQFDYPEIIGPGVAAE